MPQIRTDEKVDKVLHEAIQKAKEMAHEYATVDHIALALLETGDIQEVCKSMNVNAKKILNELKRYLIENYEKTNVADPEPTNGFIFLLRKTIHMASASRKEKIELIDLLVRIVNENTNEVPATAILKNNGLSKYNLESFLTNTSPVPGLEHAEGSPQEQPEIENPILLNDRAAKFDTVIGRENEINSVIQTLSRKKKNNAILVGEAGVGKTAIVEGLVKRIVAGDVPEGIKDKKVYYIDMAGLVAGSRFRGDFEKKLKDALEKVRKNDGIAFIDEIHSVIGAGSTSGGVMDAANIIKPLITSGELRTIGATTYEEKRNIFDKDKALSRRFQQVEVKEPSLETTLLILQGSIKSYEDHHKVKFAPESLKAAVDLAFKHMPDKFFPDKALDLVDETAARISSGLLKKKNNYIEVSDIEETVSKITKIPVGEVKQNEKESLKNLAPDLKKVIFGQEAAIETISATVRLGRSGIKNSEKPIGSFLFTGPTGVGKTELCRQLAKQLGLTLIRFDMSEYMERHTISKLIGSPPGYVGFDQGGLLTDAVNKNNRAVVLLDEFEKAHPDIFNALLQIMDHGKLTDSKGRPTDFRNVILVMTSNVGAEAAQTRTIGFSDLNANAQSNRDEVIKKTFSPEFRNRLSKVVHFNPLTQENIAAVVNKEIDNLSKNITDKNITLEVTSETKKYLVQKGFDPQMGARPLERVLQDTIETLLSDEILFGQLENGGHAKFIMENGQVKLIATPNPTLKVEKMAKSMSAITLEKQENMEDGNPTKKKKPKV